MAIQLSRFKGKVAVVTGASSGIGEAIAEQLVEAGLTVVGCARRLERVQKLQEKLKKKQLSGQLHPVQCDVTKEEDIVKTFKWISENLGPIAVMINNAGVVSNTTLINGDVSEWRRIMDTNLMGTAICTKEAIAQMQANQIDGHVVNLNSITGHRVYAQPQMNFYSPSKFAVTAYNEALRFELNAMQSKIKITNISPGLVETEILKANNYPYADQAFTGRVPYMKPENVADAILYVLSTPPNVMINELTIRPVGDMF